MRRLLTLLLILLSTPAISWEFTPGLPCRLTHQTAQIDVALTYDPTQPLYTITLRQTARWPEAAVFSLTFSGPAGLSISTDRHQLSPDRTALTVTDRGFGNLLNGLQFNDLATARLGDQSVAIPLTGAEGPVDLFRRCEVAAGA